MLQHGGALQKVEAHHLKVKSTEDRSASDESMRMPAMPGKTPSAEEHQNAENTTATATAFEDVGLGGCSNYANIMIREVVAAPGKT